MRTALRYLLPLTILVAAPLLGVGGVARAGYIAPVSVVARPSPDSFMAGVPQADPDEMGASSSTEEPLAQEADWPGDSAPALLPPSAVGPSAAAHFGASSGGMGSPSPNGAGTGSSSQPPALTTRPPTDAPALVGVLFLETASRLPPPFLSRLFRPPR